MIKDAERIFTFQLARTFKEANGEKMFVDFAVKKCQFEEFLTTQLLFYGICYL